MPASLKGMWCTPFSRVMDEGGGQGRTAIRMKYWLSAPPTLHPQVPGALSPGGSGPKVVITMLSQHLADRGKTGCVMNSLWSEMYKPS
ncbi:hypothetical protein PABY_10410 [Pyrodictium abyssi]|uniref:Uncharacterized protein n=1 Tax=Pyrodictium abyssi TaxID=54256 RepID=A0ABM8IV88_9CREN|nr:hypothetical protein PABY_10410 [Pyrodictium abyssi]